jgi:ParB/RepB/Spo0J family partition protein
VSVTATAPEVYVCAELQVDLLDPLPGDRNLNQMDAEEFALLVQSIRDNGFLEPIQTVPMADGRYRIIGGEHRWKAAKEVGMEKIQALVLGGPKWQDEDLQEFMSARLNHIRGSLSPQRFVKTFQRFSQKYTADSMRQLMGFKVDAWAMMLDGVEKNLKSAGLPKSAVDAFKKAKGRINTSDQLSSFLNLLVHKHGSTLPFNYMAFSMGGKEIIYTIATDPVYAAVKEMLAWAEKHQVDINALWEGILPKWKEVAEAMSYSQPPTPGNGRKNGKRS